MHIGGDVVHIQYLYSVPAGVIKENLGYLGKDVKLLMREMCNDNTLLLLFMLNNNIGVMYVLKRLVFSFKIFTGNSHSI